MRSADQLRVEFPDGEVAKGWVAQEYRSGFSYSLEVMAVGGGVRCFQVTDLFMDAGCDCKRVIAPTELPPYRVAELERIGFALSDAISLLGLMDVEVILNGGRLKVLEIDARLPSQTPTVVFWSSGENLVQLWGEATCGRELPAPQPFTSTRAVVYEHLQVSPGRLEIGGELLMAGAGTLRLHSDFFGADEALADYAPGRTEWRATLIVTGGARDEAWRKRCEVLSDICRIFGLDRFVDPEPGAAV
jgi:pyrrolysine biosynthesis protein PylC